MKFFFFEFREPIKISCPFEGEGWKVEMRVRFFTFYPLTPAFSRSPLRGGTRRTEKELHFVSCTMYFILLELQELFE